MGIITLTSDFGLADGYVAAMKGVILGLAPDALLIDVSHDIAPQDIRQAAWVLRRVTPFFPAGAIHLAVVDPGVGSTRRPVLVTTPTACFVGPDNGLFTFALDTAGATAWLLDRPAYWLPEVSHTFHGRDIFAPVAAHLARGVAPDALASPLPDPVRLPPPAPVQDADGALRGQVVTIDRFGNLITNIPGAWVTGGQWRCEIAGSHLIGPHDNYAAAAPGDLLFLVSSGGVVEIARCNGSAAEGLAAAGDAPVILRPVGDAIPTKE